MATYKVIFTDELYVEADSEEEAYDKAIYAASEYHLDEAANIKVVFEH